MNYKEKAHNTIATVHALACQSPGTWHELSSQVYKNMTTGEFDFRIKVKTLTIHQQVSLSQFIFKLWQLTYGLLQVNSHTKVVRIVCKAQNEQCLQSIQVL